MSAEAQSPINEKQLTALTHIVREVYTSENTFHTNMKMLADFASYIEKNGIKAPKELLESLEVCQSLVQNLFNQNNISQDFLKSTGGVSDKDKVVSANATAISEQLKNINETISGEAFRAMAKGIEQIAIHLYEIQKNIEKMPPKDKENLNKAFRLFQKQENIHSQLDIMDCVIQPVQRLPRHILFVSELIKNTPKEEPQFESLQKAREIVRGITTDLNEKQRVEDTKKEEANKITTHTIEAIQKIEKKWWLPEKIKEKQKKDLLHHLTEELRNITGASDKPKEVKTQEKTPPSKPLTKEQKLIDELKIKMQERGKREAAAPKNTETSKKIDQPHSTPKPSASLKEKHQPLMNELKEKLKPDRDKPEPSSDTPRRRM